MQVNMRGVAIVQGQRRLKAKPLESTSKRQDPRKRKGKDTSDSTALITWKA